MSYTSQITLEFRIKPKLVTVKFSDNTTDTVLVEVEQTVKKLLTFIATKRNISLSQIDDYCLILEEGAIPMQEQSQVSTYNIKEGVSMSLQLGPMISRVCCGLFPSHIPLLLFYPPRKSTP